jgi:hypothetical protein
MKTDSTSGKTEVLPASLRGLGNRAVARYHSSRLSAYDRGGEPRIEWRSLYT